MSFVKRARPEIPEGAKKEAQLIFHHEITSLVEKYSIPPSLVVNIDQTPLKYAPVASRTIAIFSRQMTAPVTEKLAENFIKYVKVPANMTSLFVHYKN